MAIGKSLSASPDAAFALFDPQEQTAFLAEQGTAREALGGRFTASDLLTWIVQRRSTFLRMVTEITGLLTRIEASLQGNIEFIVTADDGKQVELAFGPQIRTLLKTAASWIDQTVPDVDTQLTALQRRVSQFCAEARTTRVQRDSQIGGVLRQASQTLPLSMEQMRYEHAADFLRQDESEVHPADVGTLRELNDRIAASQTRVTDLLKGNPDAETVLKPIQQMRGSAIAALRKIQGHASRFHDPPRERLDKGRAGRIARELDGIEGLVRQALRLDASGDSVLEAMGLSLWQERWRIYELWVLCAVCLQLARASDRIDAMGRIRDGRWMLKFTRDKKAVMAFAFGGRWVDAYYQYFEQGEEQANMPDIALRLRDAGTWIAVVDPKMVQRDNKSEWKEVCLRYAEAFHPRVSIIARYYPEAPRTDRIEHASPALVCHGLRPETAGVLRNALAEAFTQVGITLATKAVVILADVSGSTQGCHMQIVSAIKRVIEAATEVDLDHSLVACFSNGWIDRRSVADFLRAPTLPAANGSTDHRAAFAAALTYLSPLSGLKEIWLFGDGQGADFDAGTMSAHNVSVHAFICHDGPSESLKALCAATGGKAVNIEG